VTWLERVLAVPCPECRREAGKACLDVVIDGKGRRFDDLVCASRIQAAEEADERGSAVHEYGGYRGAGPWKGAMCACANCGAWLTLDGVGTVVYSHDNGTTWSPGPDACPGRTTPEPR
jgi:hypothetical protein